MAHITTKRVVGAVHIQSDRKLCKLTHMLCTCKEENCSCRHMYYGQIYSPIDKYEISDY